MTVLGQLLFAGARDLSVRLGFPALTAAQLAAAESAQTAG